MKLVAAVLFITVSFAQPEIPDIKNWANDFTNTLLQDELQNLNYNLKTYQDTTTNQLVMLMIPTLDDYPLEDFAYETAAKNKIGTKEHDNGALLLIVKNDRKLRIEVGYGLEGALPDALASSIIRNVIVPHFKKNNYYAGITAGIDAIISAIAGEYKADQDSSDEDNGTPGIITLLMIIFFLFTFLFRGKRRRGIGPFIFTGGGWGSSRGSSGGFGGFSGGGGSFGGGGASGSW